MDSLAYGTRVPSARQRVCRQTQVTIASVPLSKPCFRGSGVQRIRTILPRTAMRIHRHRMQRFNVSASSYDDFSEKRDLAPSKPQTASGEMLTYYLEKEPHLFKAALEDKLKTLSEEAKAGRLRSEKRENETAENTETMDLTLSKRMEEVRIKDRSHAVQDLMYTAVLEKFVLLGIVMLQRIDEEEVPIVEVDLEALTQGVHSVEALDLVRQHVLAVMGQTSMADSSTGLRLSKLQMAQIYAASIMFGYFLRGVDKRFQLERSLGLISAYGVSDAATRLEKLFQQTASLESVADPDQPYSSSKEDETAKYSQESTDKEKDSTPSLRKYVENFDVDAMREMAALVSIEGAYLVERQTLALFGDVKQLQIEMQNAIGSDAISAEELFERVKAAVENNDVSTLLMTVGTQRRSVLEAVAYGTFLRDVEQRIDTEYNLLTALPPPPEMGSGGQGLPGPDSMGF